MTRKFLLSLLFCALFLTIAAQDDKSYRADRFDVDVAVQQDRSLLVEETVAFRFTGGPFSFVFRELPTDHTDGITDIVAGVDGIPWPQGDGPGQVEITGRNPIEVTWHLPPTSDATHTFNLSYHMLGVVEQSNEADVLDYQALPDEYDYAIDSSQIRFNYPSNIQLTGEPELLSEEQHGWGSARSDDHTIFNAVNLSPGDPFVVRLSFAPGSFSAVLPNWQTEQATQNSRAWIWFVAAAGVLVAGLIAIFRAARPYTRSIPKTESYLHKPPTDLPPALSGYLSNHSIGWQHGLATLFDLAGRGLIEIEQIKEKSLWQEGEFTVTLLNRPGGLRPHEQALIDTIFTDKSGVERDIVTLSEVGKLITSSRWKKFTETLEDEAGREGLTDPDATKRRQNFLGWGIIVMFLSFGLLLPAFLVRELFGFWTMITVGAVFLVGFLAFITSTSLSPLSDKGAQLAAAFEPFRRFLKDVSKGKMDLPDPVYYEAYLPYATAYGFAEAWVKRQAKSDYQHIPSYIRAAEDGGVNMAVFIAVIAATSNSGGAANAAAGAAGAAAAGGGASGAG